MLEGGDLASWVRQLGEAELPVLAQTTLELERLREAEDRVMARDIARVLQHDPMFTLRVLGYLQAHRSRRRTSDITTVDHALMMLGVSPFFAQFKDLPTLQDRLATHPDALLGLLQVMRRAHHAALQARDWAQLRHDVDGEEIMVAAMLHDLAEMLLWCHAPQAALQIRQRLTDEPGMRSATAQREVLGFTLAQLQHELCALWQLPVLLQLLMDDTQSNHPRVRNVVLAVNLARHAAHDWNDPALPDDFQAVATLLDMPLPDATERVRQIAAQAARADAWYLPQVQDGAAL